MALDATIIEQGIYKSEYPSFTFGGDAATDTLCTHFGIAGLAGFGVDDKSPSVEIAGALIDYLKETQKNALFATSAHCGRSTEINFMALDVFTRANLELVKTLREGKTHGSLLGTIDRTKTAMGQGASPNAQWASRCWISAQSTNVLRAVQGERYCVKRQPLRKRSAVCLILKKAISRISYAALDAGAALALKTSIEKLR